MTVKRLSVLYSETMCDSHQDQSDAEQGSQSSSTSPEHVHLLLNV